jgi:WD40 repeat protein/cellulose biosynthesis protein BcsQ
MIFTFYSYKGGVGRSMALANVAEMFYREGLKVLIVDWDLEAPGLERFFSIDIDSVREKPGLLDMILSYKQMMTKVTDKEGAFSLERLDKYLIDIYPDNKSNSEGKLWLLSSGNRSDENFNSYADQVIRFGWDDFYKNWEGELYFEYLVKEFKKAADIVFIDSRTGISEMSSPCLYQIADVIVMLCAASSQSIDGTLKMLKNFKRQEVTDLRKRQLEVLVIPARVETRSESYLFDQFSKRFEQAFKFQTPKPLNKGSQYIDLNLWELLIPYVPRYAYEEVLVFQDDGKAHAEELIKAFARLAAVITLLAEESSIIRKTIILEDVPIGDNKNYLIKFCGRSFIFGESNVSCLIDQRPRYQIEDWGSAPKKSTFLGRSDEMQQLKKWITQDNCRLVAVLGMGGIGKTDLSLKLAREIASTFDYVIWRSLEPAPEPNEILCQLLATLSNQAYATPIEKTDIDLCIQQLINYLRTYRCLLILDNVETILKGGRTSDEIHDGDYLQSFEKYGDIFKRIGEVSHQSCLLLASRETPPEIIDLVGENDSTRKLVLSGLEISVAKDFCLSVCASLTGEEDAWNRLIKYYNGNPLALRLATLCINEAYQGNISFFLSKESHLFNSLKPLLDWHVDRLSKDQADIVYWLAINHEPITVTALKLDVSVIQEFNVSFVIQSLRRRFPIEESKEFGLTLQPVIKEYILERLVVQVCKEVMDEIVDLFDKYALIKATAKDFIRKTQTRLIVKPITTRLLKHFETQSALEEKILKLLSVLRQSELPIQGYSVGNIINILCYLEADLNGLDFSNLYIRQAYLQGKDLHNVKMMQCHLSNSIFTEAFPSILSVAFNPQPEQLLATGDAGGGIRLWRGESLEQCFATRAHSSWVRSVSFNPDGTLLASASDDQLIKLWEVGDTEGNLDEKPSKKLIAFKTLIGHKYRVRSVCFSRDGKTLASSSLDKTIKLWCVNTGECLQTFSGHNDWVWTAVFNHDGSRLVSTSQDKELKIWDVKKGICTSTIELDSQVQSIAFSDNGDLMAAGSDDNTIKLWDCNWNCYEGQFKPRASLEGHSGFVRSVAFNRNDVLASAAYDNTVRLWDVEKGECCRVFTGHTHRLRSIAFSRDGNTLVSGGWDQKLKLWDIEQGEASLRTLQGWTDWICSVDISPGGELIASGSVTNDLYLWDFSNKKKPFKEFTGHSNWVWTVAFSPDEAIMASGSFDRTVRLWDIKSGRCLHTLKGHDNWVWSVAFSSDGRLLASGSDDKTVIIWNVETGKKIGSYTSEGDSEWVRSVAFHPDNKLIASGSDDSRVRIWDIDTPGKLPKKVLEGHKKRVRSIAFSPNGKLLASGSYDNNLILWDLDQWIHHTLEGHTKQVRSLAFSYDGKYLASGGNDKTIRLWDPDLFTCIHIFEGHTDEVRSVSFCRTKNILVSSSKDGTIRIWDISSKCEIDRFSRTRLYENLDITRATGLSALQKASLMALGAKDEGSDE